MENDILLLLLYKFDILFSFIVKRHEFLIWALYKFHYYKCMENKKN